MTMEKFNVNGKNKDLKKNDALAPIEGKILLFFLLKTKNLE